MKIILYYATIAVSILFFVFGYLHYQEKLNSIAAEANEQANALGVSLEETTAEDEVIRKLDGTIKELAARKEKGDEIRVTVFGSTALTSVDEADSFPHLLVSEIQLSLPDHELTLTVIDVDQATSAEVLENDYLDPVIDSQPDLLLTELLLGNDYETIAFEDSLENFEEILDQSKEALPDTKIVTFPTNPIPNAEDYYIYSNELKDIIRDKGYEYANHWRAWPKENDELSQYVKDHLPTKEGHVIWADYMATYLLQ
ncbi:SGNH/GDSL hydrolase family protein [Halalkalibacter kiskunsagensis]|uniref:SGNH/GDSL hydrolase family protein n=1 Tax=Halalkalibacter kiskunsagensis TaxID=1548599 RepID=A0ABV6K947_9BACI